MVSSWFNLSDPALVSAALLERPPFKLSKLAPDEIERLLLAREPARLTVPFAISVSPL